MPIQRNQLGKNSIDRDTRNLRARLNIQGLTAGQTTDHGTLLGLADDDHANYVHLSAARTIIGQHSFTPGSPQAPFLLGANAQGQIVTGLNADELDGFDSSNAPGAAARILRTDTSGYLHIEKIGLGSSAPSVPLHIRAITNQVRIDYDASNLLYITVDATGSTVLDATGSTGSLRLQGDGDIVFNPLGADVLPFTNDLVNLGHIQKKYLTLHVSELWAQTLVAAEVLATIGGQILVGPTTTLKADLASGSLLVNQDFENRTGNDFDNWTETVGAGSIVAETGDVNRGSSAVKITTGASDNTYFESDAITVTADTGYSLTLFSRVDSGDSAGRLSIWDNSNSAWIVLQRTLTTSATWTQVGATFVTPTSCVSIKIGFEASATNTDVAYYDDAWLTMDEIVLEHNQPDDNDALVMRSEGKLEWMQVNQFDIDTADTASDYFELDSNYGDCTPKFPTDKKFQIRNSTGNDGEYTVISSTFTGGKTRISVAVVADATSDGYIAYTMDDTAGPYTYHRCNRNRDRTGANAWYEGDALVNTGVTGDGVIDIYSVSGLEYGAGPSIVGSVRISTNYNSIEERWAIGNLNGLYGYASDEYGFAAGDPNGSRISIEDTNGIRFYGNNILKGNIDLSGNLWFGDSSATERLSWDSTNGIQIYNASNVAVVKFPISGNAQIVGTLDLVSPGELSIANGDVVIDDEGISLNGEPTSPGGAEPTFLTWRDDGGTADGWIGVIYSSGADYLLIESLDPDAPVRIKATPFGSNPGIELVTDTEITGWLQLSGSVFTDTHVYINETSNLESSKGMTIKGDGLQNELFTLKSPEVDHGMTDLTETDTIFRIIRSIDGTSGGGANLESYSKGNNSLILAGVVTSATSTTSTSAVAPVLLSGALKSSATKTNVGSTNNAVVMRSYLSTRWIMKGDGEIHNDYHATGSMGTNYDAYHDIELLRSFDLKTAIPGLAETWIDNNLEILTNLGIVTPHDDGTNGYFVSQQRMTKLQIGAIWQLHEKINTLEAQVKEFINNGI